jgi:hypothetical protein
MLGWQKRGWIHRYSAASPEIDKNKNAAITPPSPDEFHEMFSDKADGFGRRIIGVGRKRVTPRNDFGPRLRRAGGTK